MKKIPFPIAKKHIVASNAFEANFGKLVTPLEHFIKSETNSGILLVFCTIIALIIGNSPYLATYEALLLTHIQVGAENFMLSLSLHHWINDGLMTFFFFLVGLEIKREVLVGELSNLRHALLPVCAAVGGMIVPALFYALLNPSNSVGAHGWGIPMATDIAFAVTALVLLGDRRPKSLMTFLIALAIVDDMGAVLVIAFFYTDNLHLVSLLWAALIFAGMVILNLAGVRRTSIYALFACFLWVFIHHSGIHATIAGILAALTIPARPKYRPSIFLKGAGQLLGKYKQAYHRDGDVLRSTEMATVLQALDKGVNKAQTPLQNLEHAHHVPVNFVIIPIFALANAAITVDVHALGDVLFDKVTLGVMVGLLLGKPIGITLATWLAVKCKLSVLPNSMTMHHVFGAGLLAGIGFTMSIFITELAFNGSKHLLNHAKTGILLASILAGIIGFIYLDVLYRMRKRKRLQTITNGVNNQA